ncbi:MAG: hypothetical protein CBB68_09580 [Rhodospirillaceae bacterium TMED8]|nr:hypothetical protein [Magnetovibrio sp.]OUT50111.1 MAG: hypothetical protein CBB68_09580 [Rhodospirillaceae bacterium TMED8]
MDLEEFFDIARGKISTAPNDQKEKVTYELRTNFSGLPEPQLERLMAYCDYYSGNTHGALARLSECYNEDKYFGNLIDFGVFSLANGSISYHDLDTLISTLGLLSRTLRENNFNKFALRADFVASSLLFRSRTNIKQATVLKDKWYDHAGALSYSDQDLENFFDDPFSIPEHKRFLGYLWSFSAELDLTRRLNRIFTVHLLTDREPEQPKPEIFGGLDPDIVAPYHLNPSFVRINDFFAEMLFENCPIGRALDLGCGTGLLGERQRDCTKNLVGLDINSAVLEVARRKNIYDELVEEPMIDYLVRSEPAFDAITGCMAFDWHPDLMRVISLSWQRLNLGGKMMFAFSPVDEGPIRVSRGKMGGLNYFCYNPKSVAEHATAVGFELEHVFEGHYQWSSGVYMRLKKLK